MKDRKRDDGSHSRRERSRRQRAREARDRDGLDLARREHAPDQANGGAWHEVLHQAAELGIRAEVVPRACATQLACLGGKPDRPTVPALAAAHALDHR
jgi:hypothetical protein